MSLVDRVSTFMLDRVAPHLPLGCSSRPVLDREAVERQARAELEARIRMGRPGPEEAVPLEARKGRRARPVPQLPQEPQPRPAVPRPTRPLEVLQVRVDVLAGPVELAAPEREPLSDPA